VGLAKRYDGARERVDARPTIDLIALR
jgi:hypothetical protein